MQRSLTRRTHVSEIWVLMPADYKQMSAGHRQAAGQGAGGPTWVLMPADYKQMSAAHRQTAGQGRAGPNRILFFTDLIDTLIMMVTLGSKKYAHVPLTQVWEPKLRHLLLVLNLTHS